MSRNLFNAIASYSKTYWDRHLSYIEPNKLTNNFWPALDFFLSRACYQGRRDEISVKVYWAAIETLKPKLSTSDGASKYQILKKQNWKPVEIALRSKIGKGYVGKARDVDMVLSTLDFISSLPDLNLVRYSVEQIKRGNLEKHYLELQARRSESGIVQVGPKIAGLYLRDIVSLYDLDSKISYSSAYCLQPVDTWVRKLAYRLKIVNEGGSDQQIQKAIVSLCKSKGVSPLLFNQGAWYVGYNAFDIALELLDRSE